MRLRIAPRATACALAVASAVAAWPARAVFTTVTDLTPFYGLTLQIGAATGVDTVSFLVTGNNAGLTPTAVVGTPSIGIVVTPVRPILTVGAARLVTLKMDSSAGLTCQAGACGTTVIPFSDIRWIASGNGAAGSGDVQSGRFDNSADQTIANFDAYATVCNSPCNSLLPSYSYPSRKLTGTTLQFVFDNTVMYPAGSYQGVVHFTASML